MGKYETCEIKVFSDVASLASVTVWEWRGPITKSTFKGISLLSEATRTSPDLGQNDMELSLEVSCSASFLKEL